MYNYMYPLIFITILKNISFNITLIKNVQFNINIIKHVIT